MNTLGSSNIIIEAERKKAKKSKLVEYGITFTVVAACLVAVFTVFGNQAAEDWTTLKANLDPDWAPEASQTVEGQKAAAKRANIGTAGGD